MDRLGDLLSAEEELFRREEMILRQFSQVRGIRNEHIEPLVQMHLKDCSDYFLLHQTVDGPFTPWMIGNRRVQDGKKEDS